MISTENSATAEITEVIEGGASGDRHSVPMSSAATAIVVAFVFGGTLMSVEDHSHAPTPRTLVRVQYLPDPYADYLAHHMGERHFGVQDLP